MAHTVERLIWRKGFRPDHPPTPAALHRQIQLATQFAAFAACNDDLQILQRETCRVAAEGLKGTFAKLLVYQSDDQTFALEAGVGWRSGIVGSIRLGADTDTTAGFAWHSGQPVIVNDLVFERRFRMPTCLAEHEVTSCINVVVPGIEAAYGVLEVESSEPGRFAAHDVSFLDLLAHSLTSAISRVALRARFEAQAARITLEHGASLHELQHRVRNDLQVVYSLVVREARQTADPAGQQGFERVGGRVMALGELYNHLLSQPDINEVDMGAYLRSLCDKITCATDFFTQGITLKAETECLMMPLDRAVRLAVAVNELITNAARHAFPNSASGKIMIKLIAKDADGGASTVSITDDGCGFRGPRPGGVGLTFAKQCIHQAGGVLEREDGGGTTWRIRLLP